MSDGMTKRDRVALMAAMLCKNWSSPQTAVDTAFEIDKLVADRLDGKPQEPTEAKQ